MWPAGRRSMTLEQVSDATGPAGDQCRQSEDTSFSLVVGAHHDHHVLDGDDEHEGVDDEREHAEHVLVRRRDGMRSEEALFERVQRTGADVAVDNAECSNSEWKKAFVLAG